MYLQRGSAAVLFIVGVIDQYRRVALLVNGVVAGTPPAFAAFEDKRPATLHHGLAVSIHIRPGDLRGTPDHDAIRAEEAPAAEVEGDEEVVIAVPLDDERRFNGGVARLGRQRIERGIRRRLHRRRVEADQLDAAPKRAKTEPQLPGSVLHDVGINGVIVIRFFGLDDDAFVHPGVVGILGVQCGVGGKSDRRDVAAKTGNGVVEIVFALIIEDVGRPEVPIISGDYLFVPVRLRIEHLAYGLPVAAILGTFHVDAVAGREDVPGVILFDDHRIVGVEVAG